MTDNWLERTELLLGAEKLEKLRAAHVLVVGLGGVGAYAAEMIARAGVGRMTVADADTVNPTNINRQLVALHSTVGRPKAEVLAERLRDINPGIGLTVVDKYIKDEETDLLLDSARFDYAVDAIDTLSPKLALILGALKRGIPLVSSMGAGAKTDPTRLAPTTARWPTCCANGFTKPEYAAASKPYSPPNRYAKARRSSAKNRTRNPTRARSPTCPPSSA
jgi:tRNA A37 threonylcarbamoyladenosine dehydratase